MSLTDDIVDAIDRLPELFVNDDGSVDVDALYNAFVDANYDMCIKTGFAVVTPVIVFKTAADAAAQLWVQRHVQSRS